MKKQTHNRLWKMCRLPVVLIWWCSFHHFGTRIANRRVYIESYLGPIHSEGEASRLADVERRAHARVYDLWFFKPYHVSAEEQEAAQLVDYHGGVCWQAVTESMTCTRPLAPHIDTTYTECCCLHGEAWGMDCALCPPRDTGTHTGGILYTYCLISQLLATCSL